MLQCKQKRAHKAQTQETVVCFSFWGETDENESVQEILQVHNNNVVWWQKQNKPKKKKNPKKNKKQKITNQRKTKDTHTQNPSCRVDLSATHF